MKLKKANHLRGEVTVPGDKSISHRSIMLGSIAKGTTEIHNLFDVVESIDDGKLLDLLKTTNKVS